MQQLSGSDTGFLYAEQGNMYNHVASLAIYDPSTAADGNADGGPTDGSPVRFKDILAHFRERLHVNPLFRRRLVEVPFGVDRPYWVEEPDCDVEFHVRHIALPAPGDWRQLMIQVARLHARPLDRSRPLWEIYVIEGLDLIPGLPAGCFAMMYKMHHASVDGMAGLHLVSQIHSWSPEPLDSSSGSRVVMADRDPTALELTARAVINNTRRAVDLSRLYTNMAGKLGGAVLGSVSERMKQKPSSGGESSIFSQKRKAPETRFSHKISGHRVVEGVGLPMAAIKALRSQVDGVTVNDVFLALVGGSMRKYLQSKGELPNRSLTTMMPISLRADASAGGNDVGFAVVAIRTDIEDPLERLRACHQLALAEKQKNGLFASELPNLTEMMPNFITDLLAKQWITPSLNTVVSNVRGPTQPLFMAGAKLERFYPVSIPGDHIGINHTAISYAGTMWLGVVSCRDMMPDPGFYAQCIRDSFNEMLVAAGVSPVADSAFTNAPEASIKPARKTSETRRHRK